MLGVCTVVLMVRLQGLRLFPISHIYDHSTSAIVESLSTTSDLRFVHLQRLPSIRVDLQQSYIP